MGLQSSTVAANCRWSVHPGAPSSQDLAAAEWTSLSALLQHTILAHARSLQASDAGARLAALATVIQTCASQHVLDDDRCVLLLPFLCVPMS